MYFLKIAGLLLTDNYYDWFYVKADLVHRNLQIAIILVSKNSESSLAEVSIRHDVITWP